MDKRTSSPKITILGVGNELLSDEGAGIHIIRELQKMDNFPGVEIIEGGTLGFGLINIIIETDYLIVIDSVRGGGKPGSIYRFDIKDAPGCPDLFRTSVHQVGILEVIHLSGLIGNTPKTTVIGIEPRAVGRGMALSPEIQKKIPRVMALIRQEIENIAGHTG